jgi:L-arabonate dehydrase
MTFKPAKWPRKLRSQEWFAGTSKDAIYHRSWMKNQGLPADLFDGRPVIGILNTGQRPEPLQRPPERPGRTGEARGL